MKGYEDRLIHYMEGSDKRFVIPVYQRNYDWKIEQCKQLFDDLIKVVTTPERKSHFFGSIVSVNDPAGHMLDFLIIDGQQRLTTVSLLFLAMYNMLESRAVVSGDPMLPAKILKKYLVDEWKSDEARIKLKPIKNDRAAFSQLFDHPQEAIINSNLTINYQYFCSRISSMPITIDALFEAISRLEIINIVLNHEDNPQLIFESLNSTGLDLSEGDKIRNYILMGLPSNQQETLYDNYWNKIEVCTTYDVSSFVRDYLSIKQQSTPAIRNVYTRFKEFVESKCGGNIEDLLKDLLDYAKHYETLLCANTESEQLNGCIHRLNRLKTTVTRPFLLEVLRMHAEGKIDTPALCKIFLTCENYLFRRNICDLPTNALNKIFLLLHREILRLDGNSENYDKKFDYVLLGKKETGRFPTDEEFLDALSTKNVYAMKGESKVYLFERLENFGTIETKDIWAHLDKGDYTIEHIMPQHLTAVWTEELGVEYEKVHATWLHRLANLTLTGYNSTYSNRSFLEKRDMKNGFRDSGLRMNQWISFQEKWTEDELKERNALLTKMALEIWPFPVTDYQAPTKQLDGIGLDDEIDFKGKVLMRYSFRGLNQVVGSWADMYQQVLAQLHREDKSILITLAVNADETVDLASHFATNENAFDSCRMVDQNIFVWTGTNTQYKITVLRKVFALFGVEQNELLFYLKDEVAPTEEDTDRYGIRRRYWAFALPIMRERSGTFYNVNPSKSNWINGYLGLNGVHICCVANFDSARVELYLEMPEKSRNKALFDYLYSRKSQLENLAECTFVWNRSDESKSSKIYVVLSDVGIANEEDWPILADFHAKNSKLFKDVFSPILTEFFNHN